MHNFLAVTETKSQDPLAAYVHTMMHMAAPGTRQLNLIHIQNHPAL